MNYTNQKTLQSLFIGIDVSKYFFEICFMDESGKVQKTFQISPDLKGFIKLLKQLPKASSPVFAMENTGPLAGNLCHYLKKNNYQVIMSNPFEISRLRDAFSKSVKSDLIDAFVIAQALRMNILKASEKDENYIFLQDLLERFYDLKDRRRALINQLRSNLEQTFPEIDRMFTKISCNSALAILSFYPTPIDLLDATIESIKLVIKRENGKITQTRLDKLLLLCEDSVAWKTQPCHKIIIQSQVRELKMVKEEIKFINDAISEFVDDTFRNEIQLLKSVPGINDLTAFHTLAIIGNHERFDPEHDGDGSKRVSSFVGYGLREYSSGYRKVESWNK